MVVITYEEKMKWLNYHLKKLKEHQAKSTFDFGLTQKSIDVIECIIEDVRDFKELSDKAEELKKKGDEDNNAWEELFY